MAKKDGEGHIYNLETTADGLIERFNVKALPPPTGHYKHVCAVRTGPEDRPERYDLYISGMIPLDLEGRNVVSKRDMFEQTKQVLIHIGNAIIGAGARYDIEIQSLEEALGCLVETNVFIADMGSFGSLNDAYKEMNMPKTCRAAVEPAKVPLQKQEGVLVEIKSYAVIAPKYD